MEGTGAVQWSIDQYMLKYTTFVGDRDSGTFKVVQEGMQELYGGRNYLKHNKGRKLAENEFRGGFRLYHMRYITQSKFQISLFQTL